MPKVNVAVIGVGGWGKHYPRVLSGLNNCRLVAICDANRKRAEKFGEAYGGEFFNDSQQMLKRVRELDAVTVVTPTPTHYEIAMQAINSGKHTFVEKPLCDSAEKARKIVESTKKRGVKLMVGHIERFNPAVQELKKLLDAEKLGNLISLSSRRVGRPVKMSEVGVVKDLAVHDIDIMRFLVGKEPKSVFARCGSVESVSFEDHAELMLTFDDVKTGYIEVNWLTVPKERSLTVTCTNAVATVNYVDRSLAVKYPDKTVRPIFAREEPLKLELSHFINCILRDEEPLVTGSDGLRSLEISEAALKSARSQEVIRLR